MTTMAVSKEVEFDAGHRVPNHQSKCFAPHGHRYRVRVTCTGPIVDDPDRPDAGMVVDFGDLKAWLVTYIHDLFDHAMIVADTDTDLRAALGVDADAAPNVRVEAGHGWPVVVTACVPTAENLATLIAGLLAPVVADHWHDRLTVSTVEVWETPTSLAVWQR